MKKRVSLAVILGITTMLLALAPQLRADRTDHFKDNDHWNAMRSAESHGRESDADLKHADAWRSDNERNKAKAMCFGNGDGSSKDNGKLKGIGRNLCHNFFEHRSGCRREKSAQKQNERGGFRRRRSCCCAGARTTHVATAVSGTAGAAEHRCNGAASFFILAMFYYSALLSGKFLCSATSAATFTISS